MIKRRAIAIFFILVMTFVISGCSGNGPKYESGRTGEEEEIVLTASELAKAKTVCYQTYFNVLTSNASEIRSYDWQNYNTSYSTNTEGLSPVAFSDINGDGIPEMFFFTSDGHVAAKLHIYSYVDGEAKEIDYAKGIIDDSSTYADGLFTDVNASAGTTYVIYTGREKGSLFIYHTVGDDTKGQYIYEFYMNPKGKVFVESSVGLTSERKRSKWKETYYSDGKKTSAGKGESLFAERFDDVNEVLLYSVYDINNPPPETIWTKVNKDTALQMSHEEALAYVNENMGEGDVSEAEIVDGGEIKYEITPVSEEEEDFSVKYDLISIDSEDGSYSGDTLESNFESYVLREMNETVTSFDAWEGGGTIEHSILEVNTGSNYVSVQGWLKVYVDGLAYGWGNGISMTYDPSTGEEYDICTFTGLSINELNNRLKKNLPESGEIQKNVYTAFGYEHLAEPYESDYESLRNFYVDENGDVWLDNAVYPPAFDGDALPVIIGNISDF